MKVFPSTNLVNDARTNFCTPLTSTQGQALQGLYIDNVPDHLHSLELRFGIANLGIRWTREKLLEMQGQNLMSSYFNEPIPIYLATSEPPLLQWITYRGDVTIPDHRAEYVESDIVLPDGENARVCFRLRTEGDFVFRRSGNNRQVAVIEDGYPVFTSPWSYEPRTVVQTELDAHECIESIHIDNIPATLKKLTFLMGQNHTSVKWTRDELMGLVGTNILAPFFDEPLPVCLSGKAVPTFIWDFDGVECIVPDVRVEYKPFMYSVKMRTTTRCREDNEEDVEQFNDWAERGFNPQRVSSDKIIVQNNLIFGGGLAGMKYIFDADY